MNPARQRPKKAISRLTAEDQQDVREVLYRYCFAVDTGTVEDVMDLFADSCDLQIIPGKLHSGREAVWKWYHTLTTKRMDVLRHLSHNQTIDLVEQIAVSKSYWDAVGDMNGEPMVAAGFYEDHLRKKKGNWKIFKKIIRIDYMVPLKEGWGGPARIKKRLLQEIENGSTGWR
jgi:ketosteroid isomerase-like protein